LKQAGIRIRAAEPSDGEALARRVCRVSYLGLTGYQEAWDLQRKLGELRGRDEIPDTLLLLEHSHTYTLGRTADPANLLLGAAELKARGAEVFHIDRGGDVTYHGPGQLVGYPIMLVEDRRDLLRYIRNLEETIILTLADFEIVSGRIEGLSGVWIGDKKIAAIGVKMGRVTSHGFALNVTTDLSYFSHIVPCGIRDKGVTSMAEQLPHRAVSCVDRGATVEIVDEARIGRRAEPVAPAAPPLAVTTVATTIAKRFGGVFDRAMQPLTIRPMR
jgi:lipoyl(octanoyl) transferase